MENKNRRIDRLIRRCVDKRVITIGGACRLWIELDSWTETADYEPAKGCADCVPPWWTVCPTCGRAAVDFRNVCIECGARADA